MSVKGKKIMKCRSKKNFYFYILPSLKCLCFSVATSIAFMACNQGETTPASQIAQVSKIDEKFTFRTTLMPGKMGFATLSETSPVVCKHKIKSKVIEKVELEMRKRIASIYFTEQNKEPMTLRCQTLTVGEQNSINGIECTTSNGDNSENQMKVGGFSFRMSLERLYLSSAATPTAAQGQPITGSAVASLIPRGLTGALSAIFSAGGDQLDCAVTLEDFK